MKIIFLCIPKVTEERSGIYYSEDPRIWIRNKFHGSPTPTLFRATARHPNSRLKKSKVMSYIKIYGNNWTMEV
jgi:hypothetical protein